MELFDAASCSQSSEPLPLYTLSLYDFLFLRMYFMRSSSTMNFYKANNCQ